MLRTLMWETFLAFPKSLLADQSQNIWYAQISLVHSNIYVEKRSNLEDLVNQHICSYFRNNVSSIADNEFLTKSLFLVKQAKMFIQV